MNGFLKQLREDLTDVSLWKIFRDNLEENGDYVRLEVIEKILELFKNRKGMKCLHSRFITKGLRNDAALVFKDGMCIWVYQDRHEAYLDFKLEKIGCSYKMWKDPIQGETLKEIIL